MSHLNDTFFALSDPTRRAIIEQLAIRETPLSELAQPFDISLTAVSKHVRVLSDGGLVVLEKRGRTRYCRLDTDRMRDAHTWLNQYQKFWASQFDALAQHLAKTGPEK